MKEKVIGKKIGMPMLVIIILLYIASTIGIGFGAYQAELYGDAWLVIISLVVMTLAIVLTPGLKVLKPQEALVLTLFGKYVGTLKGDGFYFVNPFCTSFNPAAKTKLKQSGDVNSVSRGQSFTDIKGADTYNVQNKISLKVMTLNNNRQKINNFA